MTARLCLGPETFLALLELCISLAIDLYLNCCLAGFKAAFYEPEGLWKLGAHMGLSTGDACAVLAQADTCPALGLGGPSPEADIVFLQLTEQLRACGSSLGHLSEATSGPGLGASLSVQAITRALHMASPSLSWANGDYGTVVSGFFKERSGTFVMVLPGSWLFTWGMGLVGRVKQASQTKDRAGIVVFMHQPLKGSMGQGSGLMGVCEL